MRAQLAAQFGGRVQFLKVDVDKVQDVARHYSVSAMPTFLALKGTDKLDQVRGADAQGLAAMVAKHAPTTGSGAASGSASSSAFEGFVSRAGRPPGPCRGLCLGLDSTTDACFAFDWRCSRL